MTFQDATTTRFFAAAQPINVNLPINMPATVDAGDYLFALHVASTVASAPPGWTSILTGLGVSWWRLADGTEGGTTQNWKTASAGTHDYVVHAVIVRYKFDTPFNTPIGNSGQWAFGDTSTFGTKTASNTYATNIPGTYELRLYVLTDTSASQNFIDPDLGQIGLPRPAGPVAWTNATEIYSDEAEGSLGSVTNAAGTALRCDLLVVAEREVQADESVGTHVDVTLSPDGGQVGFAFRVRLAFPTPPTVAYWGINATTPA